MRPTLYCYAKLYKCIPVSFWDGGKFQPDPAEAMIFRSPPQSLGDGTLILIFTGSLRGALRVDKIKAI